MRITLDVGQVFVSQLNFPVFERARTRWRFSFAAVFFLGATFPFAASFFLEAGFVFAIFPLDECFLAMTSTP
jgi:hypothetical protein